MDFISYQHHQHTNHLATLTLVYSEGCLSHRFGWDFGCALYRLRSTDRCSHQMDFSSIDGPFSVFSVLLAVTRLLELPTKKLFTTKFDCIDVSPLWVVHAHKSEILRPLVYDASFISWLFKSCSSPCPRNCHHLAIKTFELLIKFIQNTIFRRFVFIIF